MRHFFITPHFLSDGTSRESGDSPMKTTFASPRAGVREQQYFDQR